MTSFASYFQILPEFNSFSLDLPDLLNWLNIGMIKDNQIIHIKFRYQVSINFGLRIKSNIN